MIEGKYAIWQEGHPICPECKGTQFDVGFREVIAYPIYTTKPKDSMDNFYNHEHTEGYDEPIVFMMCSYCKVDIALTDKIIEFLKSYGG